MNCIRRNAAPRQVRDFNIIYLGGTVGFKMKSETITVSDAHRRSGLVCGVNTYQTHAYIMSKAVAAPLAATLSDGYEDDAALAWFSKRVDQSMLRFRFEPPLMQQKNQEGDSDIINKVVRAAGVSFQHYNKGECKRCHEQNMKGDGQRQSQRAAEGT